MCVDAALSSQIKYAHFLHNAAHSATSNILCPSRKCVNVNMLQSLRSFMWFADCILAVGADGQLTQIASTSDEANKPFAAVVREPYLVLYLRHLIVITLL